MTTQPMSLLDVLAPPPNHWLMSISRRRAELPPCVRVIRFSDDSDDQALEAELPPAHGHTAKTRSPRSGRR